MELVDYHNRYQSLKAAKGSKMDLMEQAAQFFEPEDALLTGDSGISSQSGQYRELLDTTGTDVIEEYLTSVLGMSYSTDRRWFKIEHPDVPVDTDNQRILNARAEVVLKEIGKTNYYQQIPHFERQVVCNGHGLMVITKDEDSIAKCYSKDPYEVVYSADVYGNVYEIYWSNEYSYIDLLRMFPSSKDNVDKVLDPYFQNYNDSHNDSIKVATKNDFHYEVISCYYPLSEKVLCDTEEDEEQRKEKKKYVQKFIFFNRMATEDDEKYAPLKAEYFNEQTVFIARDNPNTDDGYGKGIYRDLLPQARILNRLQHCLLTMAAFQAEPPSIMTAEIFDDLGIEKKVKPNQVFIKAQKNSGFVGATNTPDVELLQIKGNIAHVEAIYNKRQEQISNKLPLNSSVYKVSRQSVEEIRQRLQQQEKKLAPLRANYVREGLSKHLRAFYALCEREGLFKNSLGDQSLEAPEGLDFNADNMKLIFDGHLLQKHRETRASAILQSIQAMSVIASVSPQSLAYIDGDKVVKELFESKNVLDALKSDERVLEERKATVSQAEQVNEREDAKVVGDNANTAAKIVSTLGQG